MHDQHNTDDAAITRGSGNVFVDLGFEREEAASLQIRSDLMIRLRQYIKEARLTQEQAAERLGVHQPRVSDLVRGKIEVFSIDSLVDMLAKAGVQVQVTFQEPARSQ
ncbi:MAG TPA: helix-turn-helix transcriptional regulator [Rhodothermales bacterium]|nr:helix-turn-helix transcriptional regulator [Rhodothermales bacterium]